MSIHARPCHAALMHIVNQKNMPHGVAAYQVSKRTIVECVFQPAKTFCAVKMHNALFLLKEVPVLVCKDITVIHLPEDLVFLMFAPLLIRVKSLKFAYLDDGKFEIKKNKN